MVRPGGWVFHGPMDGEAYERSRRLFQAFHLEDALRDPEVDVLRVLRGARSFLAGHLGDALRWEEEILDRQGRRPDCRSLRHRMLLGEIEGFGDDVWAYQSESGWSRQGELAPLRWRLLRRVHRIEALLDLSMCGEGRGKEGRVPVPCTPSSG